MARRCSIDSEQLTDTTFYILSTLVERKHGYLIMKTVEELTEGSITIGPASLYTTLKRLLEAELIELDEEKSKKTYIITNKGKEMLLKEIQRKKDMLRFAEYFLERERNDGCEK